VYYSYGGRPVLPPFPTRRSSDLEALEDFAPDLGVDGLEQLAGPQHVAADDGPREVEAGLGEFALEPVVRRVVAEALVDQVRDQRSEEHTSELQSRENLVCRLLLE